MFFADQTFSMGDISPTISAPKSGQQSRKRPFSVANSFLDDSQKENLDDCNILSSFGMSKEQSIFNGSESSSIFKKPAIETETVEPQQKSPKKIVGKSPYFRSSTPSVVEVSSKVDTTDIPKDGSKDPLSISNEMQTRRLADSPMKTPESNSLILSSSAIDQSLEMQTRRLTNSPTKTSESHSLILSSTAKDQSLENELNPRKPRQIGEYSVGSLQKEFHEVIEYLKEVREKDLELFAECSKSLRQRTECIIENLENMIKDRYQTLDENLQSIMDEFEKEWETSKVLEDEFISLKAQLSAIMNTILKSPCFE